MHFSQKPIISFSGDLHNIWGPISIYWENFRLGKIGPKRSNTTKRPQARNLALLFSFVLEHGEEGPSNTYLLSFFLANFLFNFEMIFMKCKI